ncbi:MAG: hypothetical protein M1817_000273 [Caeruleum heppii]|nr:MAG: hypothetical protein M1817_000273 [Caeruleum heppii]
MHRKPLHAIVYNHLYPSPRPTDPQSFTNHLSKYLVPEVRAETQTFYGTLDCIEARYPGLDYTRAPHRMRLGRFPHHRRLFRAFVELRLTNEEILALCRWEGTRWARERYEREEGRRVVDTTGAEIPHWTKVEAASSQSTSQTSGMPLTVEMEGVCQQEAGVHGIDGADEADEEEEEDGEDEEEEEEGEIESVGIELNRRLNAAAEARARGAEVVMDAEWEQWLKEAAERGVLNDPIGALRAAPSFPPIPLGAVDHVGTAVQPTSAPAATTGPVRTPGTAL